MDKKKVVIWVIGAVLLVGILALLFMPKSNGASLPGTTPGKSADITPAQLRALVQQGAQLVDVRTPAEFAGGHIDGALNIPVDDVTGGGAASLDKTKPVVVYCQTGSRSANAAAYLAANGYSSVYNLARGIEVWDGKVVSGGGAGGSATAAATGKPTMYAFMTGT